MDSVKPPTRRSITFRMTVVVCAFVILVQSLLAVLTIVYFRHEFKQNISEQQFTLLTVLAQNIDQKLKAAQMELTEIASEVTTDMVANPDAAQHFLDHHPDAKSVFDNGLFIFSADGRLIVESPYIKNRRGRDISFREFYKKTVATGKPLISAPFISTHTPNTPTVMFTTPIRDKNGKLIAILGGGINLLRDNFLGELSRTRIAKTGYLFLFNQERIMIMHPDKQRIMKIAVKPGINKLLDRSLNGFEGSGENINSTGLEALSSFKRLQTTDWIIAANYPLSEAYEPIKRIQKYFVIAMLISSLLLIVAIRLIMERYTHTLVSFAAHVKNIATKQGQDRLFANDSMNEIGVLVKAFNAMVEDYDNKSEQLFHFSTHDALSGLYNRSYFDEELKRLSSGRLAPISVVMADIDDLKVFNDTYGHSAGDRLIKTTARILLKTFRTEDVIARIGGDEFAVLLPGVDADHAEIAVKRVRSIAASYEMEEAHFPISISLGCATAENPAELEEAIKHADQHMYLDKVSRKMPEQESKL